MVWIGTRSDAVEDYTDVTHSAETAAELATPGRLGCPANRVLPPARIHATIFSATPDAQGPGRARAGPQPAGRPSRSSALREVHDTDAEKTNCQLDEIKPEHRRWYATLAEAKRDKGYDNCAWCIGSSTR